LIINFKLHLITFLIHRPFLFSVPYLFILLINQPFLFNLNSLNDFLKRLLPVTRFVNKSLLINIEFGILLTALFLNFLNGNFDTLEFLEFLLEILETIFYNFFTGLDPGLRVIDVVFVEVEHEEAADAGFAALAAGWFVFAGNGKDYLLRETALCLDALDAAYLAAKIAIFGSRTYVHLTNMA
jgi:uncharacterized protein (DUF2164 family)